MVKVIEKTQEERNKELRRNILEKMAKEFRRDKRKFPYIINKATDDDLYIASIMALFNGMLIQCNKKEIDVYRTKDYNFARGLAEKYEEILNETWTLKKNYNE